VAFAEEDDDGYDRGSDDEAAMKLEKPGKQSKSKEGNTPKAKRAPLKEADKKVLQEGGLSLDQVVFGGGSATAVSGFTTVYEADVQVDKPANDKGKKGGKKAQPNKDETSAAAVKNSAAAQAAGTSSSNVQQEGKGKKKNDGQVNKQATAQAPPAADKVGAKRKKPEGEKDGDASAKAKVESSKVEEEVSMAENPWLVPAQRKPHIQELPKGSKALEEGKKQKEDVAKLRKKGDARADAALLDTNARLGSVSTGKGGENVGGEDHDVDAEVPVMMAEPSAAQKKLMRTAFVDADVEQEFKMEKEQVRFLLSCNYMYVFLHIHI
jgi:hypothetical protein